MFGKDTGPESSQRKSHFGVRNEMSPFSVLRYSTALLFDAQFRLSRWEGRGASITISIRFSPAAAAAAAT